MEKVIDVSFIIPAYNLEHYIVECLESIEMQTKIVYEIIIINDGSTDNTLDIIKEYKNKDERIRIIDKQNEGVSVARNIGIENALGDYLCFVDGDDYFLNDSIHKLLNQCKLNNLDIIRGQYTIVNEVENYGIYPSKNVCNDETINGVEFLKRSMNERCSEVVPWLGLFKREFIIKNNLVFPTGIKYTEDQLFFLSALLIKSSKVKDVPICYYGYRDRPNSSTDLKYNSKKVSDIVYITEQEIKLCKNNKYERYILKYCSTTLSQIIPFYKIANTSQRKEIQTEVSKIKQKFKINNTYSLKIWFKIFSLRRFPKILDLLMRNPT